MGGTEEGVPGQGAGMGSGCRWAAGTSPHQATVPCPQHWTDEFLRWDPARFDNLTQISLPAESIWVPDILINEL